MTVKEIVYNSIKENWGSFFKRCVEKNCDEIPPRAIKSANDFLDELTKYSDEEQLNIYSKLISDKDLRTCLHENQKRQLKYVNINNYNKDVNYLVSVIFTWEDSGADRWAKDFEETQVFVSNHYIDNIDDETVQKVVRIVWECCDDRKDDEPPQNYKNIFGFPYGCQNFCRVTVKSEPLMIGV